MNFEIVGKMCDALALGERMRECQRRYFRKRTQENLLAALAAEKEFDGALRDLDGAITQAFRQQPLTAVIE